EALLVGGDSYELLCYSENDTLIYQNSSYPSCYYYWTGIETNECLSIMSDFCVTLVFKTVIYESKLLGFKYFASLELEHYDPDTDSIDKH
ncbi:MAG: hypothetical protein U9Q98_02405, partial [Bacteroidota bacterium]|nr:hypothetical protein [Bacteroidota bacterium]